jgi:tRNA threonylcarbamoyl adenosine modification protein YeaZ
MKILAIEFSSAQRSVAVVTGKPTGTGSPAAAESATATSMPAAAALRNLFHGHAEVTETGGFGANALGMVEQALVQAQIEREQIECVTVGLGPGSYTGIRAVIALAQGWQLAAQIPLLGISSADCVAECAREDGLTGEVSVIIDAQRNEFYCAGYEITAASVLEREPLRLIRPEEAQELVAAGRVLIGPEVTRWFPGGRNILPRASTLGAMALGRQDFVPGEKLEPIYLREVSFVKAPPSRHYS